MSKHNAHILTYYFWQIKKDAVWYWFPLKNSNPIISNVGS